MKSVNIAVQILLADPAVSAIVGDRVHPVFPPQNSPLPHIVVGLISEKEEDMVSGASQLHDGRVSIESRCGDVDTLSVLGELVNDAMRDKIELSIPVTGCIVTTRKAATDETDYGNQTGSQGNPSYLRRITDWYCFWRKA